MTNQQDDQLSMNPRTTTTQGEAANAMPPSPPTGPIALVEPYDAHRTFLETVKPATVLLKLNDVRRLLRPKGTGNSTTPRETADSFTPAETTVVTTSTIRDEQLRQISWQQELEYVTEFGSDYHIPADYSTYIDQSVEHRVTNILKCLLGTILIQRRCQTRNHSVTILPLIKGVTWAERAICHTALEALGFDHGVYYGTQYFTGAGNRIHELVDDVTAISHEQDYLSGLLLIGLLSPTYLERLPQTVVAASGLNQWLEAVKPRSQSPATMRQHYRTLETDVTTALTTPGATTETTQTTLTGRRDSPQPHASEIATTVEAALATVTTGATPATDQGVEQALSAAFAAQSDAIVSAVTTVTETRPATATHHDT
jgi:hypothetical protein